MRQLKITKSITNRDSASLGRYLADVSKEPMITADEEAQLAQKIRAGDATALQRLTKANLRFVVSVAKQFQNQGLSLDDLINEGNLGLMKAARRFDEKRGFKFISYAVWWIRQAVMQAISEQSRMVRLPSNRINTINRVRKAESKMEQQLERQPTTAELSEFMELGESEIRLAASAYSRHMSTDATLFDGTQSFGDTIADDSVTPPDDALMEESMKTDLCRALSLLTPLERDVLLLYFGIETRNPLSLDEIGLRHSIGRERVRQIREKAIRRLQSLLSGSDFAGHLQ